MTQMDPANPAAPKATNMPSNANTTIRVDFQLIASLVEPESRVLDVGCEDGTLLSHLWQTKRVDGRGHRAFDGWGPGGGGARTLSDSG